MNFHHLTGQPVEPKTARELQTDCPSMSKAAVYQRERRLTMTDAQKARLDATKKAVVNRAKAKKCIARASVAYAIHRKNAYLQTRVRNHLSKGRDVADIAIREFILVSKVEEIIAQIKGMEVAK